MTRHKIAADPWFAISSNLACEGNNVLAAHRVNTIFKFKQAWAAGIRNFEVDLVFRNDGKNSALWVGHDDKSMSDMDFAEYLRQVGPEAVSELKFLWLDIKNLDASNTAEIKQCLDELDKTFQLKHRVLIESHSPAGLVMFEKNNWQVSYYLPWRQIMDAASSGDKQLLQQVAGNIEQHAVGGISYDLAADQVVSEALLPLLSYPVKRYAWKTGWNMADEDLLSKLAKYPHLERLLVGFASPFGI